MWSAFCASFCGPSRVVSPGRGDPGDGVCLGISCENRETLRQWFKWSVCLAWELSHSSSLWLLLSLKCYWFKFNPSSVGLSPHSPGDSNRCDIRRPRPSPSPRVKWITPHSQEKLSIFVSNSIDFFTSWFDKWDVIFRKRDEWNMNV